MVAVSLVTYLVALAVASTTTTAREIPRYAHPTPRAGGAYPQAAAPSSSSSAPSYPASSSSAGAAYPSSPPGQAGALPQNVKTLYDSIKSQGECKKVLKKGFVDADEGDKTFAYCGDHLEDKGIIYISGNGGRLANMDVDCDGKNRDGDDGQCGSSQDTQWETRFQEQVQALAPGLDDLSPFIHDFVVFGNEGESPGYTTFDPQAHGVEPLSVMAVVCGGKLVFGIWGDTNGDDGELPMVGEASYSLAKTCFGGGINGNAGHDEADVLYIAFTGGGAAPGKQLDWQAKDSAAFQASLAEFGQKLVAKL